MYKSQFSKCLTKMYPCYWFCGPVSQNVYFRCSKKILLHMHVTLNTDLNYPSNLVCPTQKLPRIDVLKLIVTSREVTFREIFKGRWRWETRVSLKAKVTPLLSVTCGSRWSHVMHQKFKASVLLFRACLLFLLTIKQQTQSDTNKLSRDCVLTSNLWKFSID